MGIPEGLKLTQDEINRLVEKLLKEKKGKTENRSQETGKGEAKENAKKNME